MRTILVTMMAVGGMAGVLLLGACGGGGSEPEPRNENGSSFRDIVVAKLAVALDLGGDGSILWEKEDTSAWKDADLFANRILGDIQVPSLKDMKLSIVKDAASGDARTVDVRVQVADLTADYRISMRETNGQWRVTNYEVKEIVEAMGQ